MSQISYNFYEEKNSPVGIGWIVDKKIITHIRWRIRINSF